jgi:hypothetical protein
MAQNKQKNQRHAMRKLILAALAILALSVTAFAHPGGRDAYGGHYDTAKGNYHVHEGPLEGRTYKNQENMIKVLQETKGGPAIIKKAEQGKAAPPKK